MQPGEIYFLLPFIIINLDRILFNEFNSSPEECFHNACIALND